MNIPSSDCTDKEAVEFIKASKLHRLVTNRARAKKLRNRGEYLKWNCYLNGWLWVMEDK